MIYQTLQQIIQLKDASVSGDPDSSRKEKENKPRAMILMRLIWCSKERFGLGVFTDVLSLSLFDVFKLC